MRNSCLSLRAKGMRCSCRTAFAVERDISPRVVTSRLLYVTMSLNFHITAQYGYVRLISLV